MAVMTEKTRTPGVFRRGNRYAIVYRVNGKQRWESFRTLDEARRAKHARSTDLARGEFEERSRITLHEYLRDWVERYQGTGRRGYRQETRDEDQRLLENYALAYFPEKLTLTEVTPSVIAGFVAWLCDGREQAKNKHRIKAERLRAAEKPEPKPLDADARRQLADNTVRNAVRPVKSALATARREGLVRHNPAAEVPLPHRGQIEEDEDQPRPFASGVMERVVSLVHRDHRLMFELLAATGVRRSELFALEVRHLVLEGGSPRVKVRQRLRRRRGVGLVVGPLKSRHARRELPITAGLAERLAAVVAGRNGQDLVFVSKVGGLLDPDNIASRVLAPACKKAGAEWAGFHTFRHTVASRLFAEGRNAVQVQRWLGHHSPSFTLAVYVHLLDDDLGAPLRPKGAKQSANTRHAKPRHSAHGLPRQIRH